MENKKVEDLLLDINEKLKNKNTFSWRCWCGLQISILCDIIGAILIWNAMRDTSYSYSSEYGYRLGTVIIVLGNILMLYNWIVGIIPLYKSTKHYFAFKNDKERDFSAYLRNIENYSLDSIEEYIISVNKINEILDIDIWKIKDSKQIHNVLQNLITYYKNKMKKYYNPYVDPNTIPDPFEDYKVVLEKYETFLEYMKTNNRDK